MSLKHRGKLQICNTSVFSAHNCHSPLSEAVILLCLQVLLCLQNSAYLVILDGRGLLGQIYCRSGLLVWNSGSGVDLLLKAWCARQWLRAVTMQSSTAKQLQQYSCWREALDGNSFGTGAFCRHCHRWQQNYSCSLSSRRQRWCCAMYPHWKTIC